MFYMLFHLHICTLVLLLVKTNKYKSQRARAKDITCTVLIMFICKRAREKKRERDTGNEQANECRVNNLTHKYVSMFAMLHVHEHTHTRRMLRYIIKRYRELQQWICPFLFAFLHLVVSGRMSWAGVFFYVMRFTPICLSIVCEAMRKTEREWKPRTHEPSAECRVHHTVFTHEPSHSRSNFTVYLQAIPFGRKVSAELSQLMKIFIDI